MIRRITALGVSLALLLSAPVAFAAPATVQLPIQDATGHARNYKAMSSDGTLSGDLSQTNVLVDSNQTPVIGEVQASPTANTLLDRLKTVHTDLGTINITLGSPMQQTGGSVSITGTLPGFTSPPTFNCGTGCGGSGGTASNFAATFPTAGTAAGFYNGGNLSYGTVDGSHYLNVNCQIGCGGGGGGGAVTAASGAYAAGSLAAGAGVDGWNLTQGTKADTAWVSGSGSEIAILKAIANAASGALPTGTNQIGHVVLDAGSVAVASGNVADNATDSGNPVKVGCVYLTTLTTYTTTGNRANCNADQFGNIRTVAGIFKVGGTDNISNFNMGAFPVAGAQNAASQANPGVMNLGYNGATSNDWSMSRTMLATDDDTGVGVMATHTKPVSAASAGTSDSHCTAVCASSIVSGAHNIYGAGFSSTVTGWLLLYDATSCPANGTVSPLRWYSYTVANITATLSWNDLPHHLSTGIAACFSTTGPYVQTASTTAAIWIDYK